MKKKSILIEAVFILFSFALFPACGKQILSGLGSEIKLSEPLANQFFIVSKNERPTGSPVEYSCLLEKSVLENGVYKTQFLWQICDPSNIAQMRGLADSQIGTGKYWQIKNATKRRQCYLDKVDCEWSGQFTLQKEYSSTQVDILALTQNAQMKTPIRVSNQQALTARARYFVQYRTGDFFEKNSILIYLDTGGGQRICLSKALDPNHPQIQPEFLELNKFSGDYTVYEENTLEYCRQIFLLPSDYNHLSKNPFLDLGKII